MFSYLIVVTGVLVVFRQPGCYCWWCPESCFGSPGGFQPAAAAAELKPVILLLLERWKAPNKCKDQWVLSSFWNALDRVLSLFEVQGTRCLQFSYSGHPQWNLCQLVSECFGHIWASATACMYLLHAGWLMTSSFFGLTTCSKTVGIPASVHPILRFLRRSLGGRVGYRFAFGAACGPLLVVLFRAVPSGGWLGSGAMKSKWDAVPRGLKKMRPNFFGQVFIGWGAKMCKSIRQQEQLLNVFDSKNNINQKIINQNHQPKQVPKYLKLGGSQSVQTSGRIRRSWWPKRWIPWTSGCKWMFWAQRFWGCEVERYGSRKGGK